MSSFDLDSRIFVAGHRGLVGSALVRRLRSAGYSRLLCVPRSELDLRDRERVIEWFLRERPEFVFLAAAKVGGIVANRDAPVEFLHDNLAIQDAVLTAAHRANVTKLMFLGSSCIYPREAPQPIREGHLLTGPLEPTNQAYAIAKIAGLVSCEAYNRQYGTRFIAAMPTNLYGPFDNFDERSSHVLAALIRKFHRAKQAGASSVSLWGTGTPRREFLYVEDLADACLFLMRHWQPDPGEPVFVNVGVGKDSTIAELAERVARIVGYQGRIEWDPSMPDGTPRKLLDVSRLSRLGWSARTSLEEGVRATYAWYRAEAASASVSVSEA